MPILADRCTRFGPSTGPPSLSREHRGALADCAEALDDLLDADMLRVPGCGAERAPAAIRSVLWLASDAKHLYL
ncbi:MAG: hypothetical protein V9F03_14765 [Microthrixaceae bacterium]